jgi:hypothetical protein
MNQHFGGAVIAVHGQRYLELKMKRTLITLLLVSGGLVGALPAFAGNVHAGDDLSWVGQSTKSRAEVGQELQTARSQGQLVSSDFSAYPAHLQAAEQRAAGSTSEGAGFYGTSASGQAGNYASNSSNPNSIYRGN